MPLLERILLHQVQHPTGTVVVAEGERTIPFPIRRVYFLHTVPPEETRGAHAHKTLTQIAMCAQGSCRFTLDNGIERVEVRLDKPNEAIIIRPMVWHVMSEFTAGAVFLVIASDHYDESDYIRRYEDFQRAVAR